MDASAILLPDGVWVAPVPGKYRVVPPPDLNQVSDARFLLEYEFPFLLVGEIAKSGCWGEEQRHAIWQAQTWREKHGLIPGRIRGCLEGYQFGQTSDGYHHQFVPDVSFVDGDTWSRLAQAERQSAYLQCVPAVVILFASHTDQIQVLQERIARYVDGGAREGVLVDTWRGRVWIHNHGQRPYFEPLASVEFDSWPRFTLDCVALRDAQVQAGLD